MTKLVLPSRKGAKPKTTNFIPHSQLTQHGPDEASIIIESGWGEDHFLVTIGHYPQGLIMVFSPRDEDELEVVKKIVTCSYEYATGQVVI